MPGLGAFRVERVSVGHKARSRSAFIPPAVHGELPVYPAMREHLALVAGSEEKIVADIKQTGSDEQLLAQLGYKQELRRTWSGFSNFAISFSIISILAGCFTTFYFGWDFGGPVAISIGWPVIAAFILVIGFCMSELVSAYPTSGGIYWWASKLGGVKTGYYTGWIYLIG